MQERSEETRARILQAALECFSKTGYDATSVAEICTSAGVSKGAFYHHFPSKQTVFLALLEDWLAILDQNITQSYKDAVDVPTALLEMASLTGGVFQDASGRLPMFLQFWTQAQNDPVIWKATIAPYHRYQAMFTEMIQQGIREGQLQPVAPDVVSRLIVAMAVGVLLQGVLDPTGAPWDQVTREGIGLLLTGIQKRSE